MFGLLLKKELRVFFKSKGNIAIMVFLPIMLMAIFGYALSSYMQADYGTFSDGVVFYYNDRTDLEATPRFWEIVNDIHAATDVNFVETTAADAAKAGVEASEAYGLITIRDNGFEYFRSTFNEPEGGKLVRSLFVQMAGSETITTDDAAVQHTIIQSEPVDSKAYYTFTSLAFSILFLGVIIGFSVYNEKEQDTIERIQLSKAGIGRMFAAKVTTGIICAIVQMVVVFVFSKLAFQVDWGTKIIWVFLLYLLLALYSCLFGSVVGFLSKSRSSCQSIVLLVTMLSGYLGGAVTPLYLLENSIFMRIVVNISPLYWVNRATSNLRIGILDTGTLYALLVLLGLIVFISMIGFTKTRKKEAVS